MRMFITSIVIGPLMLTGALPAAGQSAVAPVSSAPLRLAAGSEPAAERDAYIQKARDQMQEWQRKLHDLGDTAAAKGKEAGTAAEDDLNKAWTKAEAEADRLQTASAEGWENARTSFEEASRKLSDAWDKARPQDK